MPTIKWKIIPPYWMSSPYDNDPPPEEEEDNEFDELIEQELTEEMKREQEFGTTERTFQCPSESTEHTKKRDKGC